MAWAAEQRTGSPTRKAVLLSIANAANYHTGRCHPSVRRICEETEFGPTAVKNALADLTAAGLIERRRRRRQDGSLGTYEYVFPHVVQADDVETGDGLPGTAGVSRPGTAGVSLNQEVLNQESVEANASTQVAIVTRRGWKADGRVVTDEEDEFARRVLAAWCAATGQRLGATTWLRKIVLRHREHPELTVDDHDRIIRATLADPWWRGDPSPSVVYANDAIFERAANAARGGGSPAERAAAIAEATLARRAG